MMRISTALCAATLLTVTWTPATAITSVGAMSCSQWLSQHASAEADGHAIRGWVLGYFEASTKFADASRTLKGLPPSQTLTGLDDKAIFALVERFCRGKPQQTLAQAVSAVDAQLFASEPQVIKSSRR